MAWFPPRRRKIDMAKTGKDKSLRHGETASAAFDIASWTLLVAFILGGMAAIVIVFTSIDMEQQWDSLADQSRARIVELESEAAKADAELRTANAYIASVNESMAESRKQIAAFERDAADARAIAARPQMTELQTPKDKRPMRVARLRNTEGREHYDRNSWRGSPIG